MSERIGIFGGTFDPPHVGHLILASEAVDFLKLDRLLWLLTPDPPHKLTQPLTDWHHRLAMLERSLVDNLDFEISKVDIDRPAPHFAVDTMHILSAQYPAAELVYIMGGDSLRDLPDWNKPHEFIQACHLLGVMRRPGDLIDVSKLELILPGLSAKVCFMDAPLLSISSHQIRQRVSEGRSFRYYVTGAVYSYIKYNKLYQ